MNTKNNEIETQSLGITNNVAMLTEKEKAHLSQAKYYSYVYGIGLIYLSNGYWDCTNSSEAVEYLDQLGIPERR
ncbi:hypothetical protein [Arcticibacter tournemirensis]